MLICVTKTKPATSVPLQSQYGTYAPTSGHFIQERVYKILYWKKWDIMCSTFWDMVAFIPKASLIQDPLNLKQNCSSRHRKDQFSGMVDVDFQTNVDFLLGQFSPIHQHFASSATAPHMLLQKTNITSQKQKWQQQPACVFAIRRTMNKKGKKSRLECDRLTFCWTLHKRNMCALLGLQFNQAYLFLIPIFCEWQELHQGLLSGAFQKCYDRPAKNDSTKGHGES